MPEPLTSYINQFASSCGIFTNDLDDVVYEMNQLGTQLTWEDNPNSGAQAKNVADALEIAVDQFGVGTTSVRQKLLQCLVWIDANWPVGDGEVTMDAMLSAMVSAEPKQVTYFIGLVDAYRAALWNQPFNAGYYAALVQGFMDKWP